MEGMKNIYKSKSMIGIVIAWVAFKVKIATGIELPPELVNQVTNALIEAGLALAAIGRLVAKNRLT